MKTTIISIAITMFIILYIGYMQWTHNKIMMLIRAGVLLLLLATMMCILVYIAVSEIGLWLRNRTQK